MTAYAVCGAYVRSFGDSISTIDEVFASKGNAERRLLSLRDECMQTLLEVREVEITKEEAKDFCEDADEVDFEE